MLKIIYVYKVITICKEGCELYDSCGMQCLRVIMHDGLGLCWSATWWKIYNLNLIKELVGSTIINKTTFLNKSIYVYNLSTLFIFITNITKSIN